MDLWFKDEAEIEGPQSGLDKEARDIRGCDLDLGARDDVVGLVSDIMQSRALLSLAIDEITGITDAAKSGDGSVDNVGIKMSGNFQCPECRQKFDTEKVKQLHWEFIHHPNRHQEVARIKRQRL